MTSIVASSIGVFSGLLPTAAGTCATLVFHVTPSKACNRKLAVYPSGWERAISKNESPVTLARASPPKVIINSNESSYFGGWNGNEAK
jgi:hypothetical protein